jgi:hypothetical protein
MEETNWRKYNSIKEGFNLPGDDYFIKVKRKIMVKTQLSKLIEQLKRLFKKIPNPITLLDEGIEAFLKSLLMLMIGQIDCKTGKLKTVMADAGNAGFTWASGKMNLLKRDSISLGNDFTDAWNTTRTGAQGAYNTTRTGAQGAYNTTRTGAQTTRTGAQDTVNKIERFSMPDTPDLIYTIQSFLDNHSKLNKTAVTTYYLTKLNAYEKSLGNPPTSDQLFIFNNEFDNILADAAVIGEIKKIEQSIPDPSYPNTSEGFADYLQETARISFSNDTPITFYPFATQYFPYPTDLPGFEQAIQNVEDPNYIQNINQYLSSLTKPADPPATPMTPTDVDTNYAFSINFNNSRTDSIQTYLKYISQWYGLLLYYKYKNDLAILFPTIEANVCMVYINYLNAIEFQKYRIYSTYLTPYELAMFNHLFYIFLMQDQITFVLQGNPNIYNLALPPDGVPSGYNSNGTVYINILPQSIFSLTTIFAMEINNRVRYLSGSISEDNYQPLPLDGTLIIPSVPNDVMPIINILLSNYILEFFTPETINGVPIPDIVVPTKDITDYYSPPGMSDCEQENNRMNDESAGYAKKIKGEIYRMICVPIIVYIAYNCYYMFFFKDCFDLSKKTDEAGNVLYERKCMECFTPIFPDWELMYHSIEGNQTDFLFEFIFKPVKMVYTLINAIKTFFRKGLLFSGGYVLKDNVPYLFFILTFIQVYGFFQLRGNIILKTLKNLSKLKLPEIQIMGKKALYEYAQGVTMVFFLFSFMKNFFGISISEYMECRNKLSLAKKAADLLLTEKKMRPGDDASFSEQKGGFFSNMTGDTIENIEVVTGGATQIPGVPSIPGVPPSKCKLKGESYENSWVKWIMTPGDGAFTKLIKIICAIFYWIIKFVVAKGMIKLSITIFTLYFFVNAVMGIGNYTTPLQSSSYKIELIHRIFYTKLCSSNYMKEPFKYLAKCFIFIFIYFLVEVVILHNLLKGMNSYSNMTTNKKDYNTGLSEKTNDNADKNSIAVKTFMIILNGLLIVFIILWCLYKAMYKMPIFVASYEEQDNPSNDKRFEYDCSKNPDAYEERSKNNILTTIMKSDELNKAFIDQFDMKTSGMKKPSSLAGFITKLGEYGKKLNDKLTELGDKAGEYKDRARETVFGKTDPDAEPKQGLLSKIASGAVNNVVTRNLIYRPIKGVASAGNYVAKTSLNSTLDVANKLTR